MGSFLWTLSEEWTFMQSNFGWFFEWNLVRFNSWFIVWELWGFRGNVRVFLGNLCEEFVWFSLQPMWNFGWVVRMNLREENSYELCLFGWKFVFVMLTRFFLLWFSFFFLIFKLMLRWYMIMIFDGVIMRCLLLWSCHNLFSSYFFVSFS